MKTPTYTAQQLKEMAGKVTDHDALKILSELISEEIALYGEEDMETVTEASMILLNRSLILRFLK